jgi:hypothetical protein
VTDELPVHVSREELHSLDVPASFEADGPFDVIFVNHGTSVHVHLHLDDDLSEVAAIEANNHYVEGDSQRAVRVTVDTSAVPDDSVLGKLKLVTGYGAQTRWVDVEVGTPADRNGSVEVDESLASPQPREDPEEPSLIAGPELPVVGLGVIALGVALVATVVFQDLLVTLGALVVLGGVLVALYVLVQG